jgi:hypothetical protein
MVGYIAGIGRLHGFVPLMCKQPFFTSLGDRRPLTTGGNICCKIYMKFYSESVYHFQA